MPGSVVSRNRDNFFDVTVQGNQFFLNTEEGTVASFDLMVVSGDLESACSLTIKKALKSGYPYGTALATITKATLAPSASAGVAPTNYFIDSLSTEGASALVLTVDVKGTTAASQIRVVAECKGDRLPSVTGGLTQPFFGDGLQTEIPPIFTPPPDGGGLFP